MDKEEKGPLIQQPSEVQIEKDIAISGQTFPENGWAIIFAGGSKKEPG